MSEAQAGLERQKERLQAYGADVAKALATPTTYMNQRDNFAQPDRTCNTTSNAMYLDWLRRTTGRPGITDDECLKQVLKTGDSTEHWVQTEVLKHFGFSTQWRTDRHTEFVYLLLEAGFPVVVNILHRGSLSAPRGGHVILLIGHTPGVLVAHDPYGTLQSNYSNRNGAFSRIGETVFETRWQGGYRTLASV
jgi:hypothetical protein